ncbi:MAG: CAP domain-containing protein, partial [Thermogutta sp.]|nr:CAP domain-containing protein [Thermogutta sp.]
MSASVVERSLFRAVASACAVAVVLLGALVRAEDQPEAASKEGDAPAAVQPAATDYGTAFRAARQADRPLVVCFYAAGQKDWCDAVTAKLGGESGVRALVALVEIGQAIRSGGKDVVLSEDPAFALLKGKPGAAVVDFSLPKDSPDYGRARRVFALPEARAFSEEQLAAIRIAAALPGELPQASAKELAKGGAAPAEAMRDDAVRPAAAFRPSLPALPWMTDYAAATRAAKEEKRMLLVYMVPEGEDQAALRDRFEKTLADPAVAELLPPYVLARLPQSAVMKDEGREVALLDHPSLQEMEHKPGLFIVDYQSEGEEYYGTVVSVFPFLSGRPYSAAQMKVILALPRGTLTQRTMVYAVSTHPERPASVRGTPDPYLFGEAESHSRYQSRIRLQGHHFWETRFHRILGRIPPGTLASEVCAESWPGQGLLAAAIECVRSWRQSSGHWRAVSSPQRAYGYDIKRGSNGIWYATGIFA